VGQRRAAGEEKCYEEEKGIMQSSGEA